MAQPYTTDQYPYFLVVAKNFCDNTDITVSPVGLIRNHALLFLITKYTVNLLPIRAKACMQSLNPNPNPNLTLTLNLSLTLSLAHI